MKTIFIRILDSDNKAAALKNAISAPDRTNYTQIFSVESSSFAAVPRSPFAYWVSTNILKLFKETSALESESRQARLGAHGSQDFRWVRCWWEAKKGIMHGFGEWKSFAKGGSYSPFYADVHLMVEWEPRRSTFLGFFGRPGREIERPESLDFFFRPGLTWPRRTTSGLSMRVMPAGCIFADKGPAAFVEGDSPDELLALLAVAQSSTFSAAVQLQLAAADAAARSYEVGVIQRTPVPELSAADREALAGLARQAWALKRSLDTRTETSHAFLLPALISVASGQWTVSSDQWSVTRAPGCSPTDHCSPTTDHSLPSTDHSPLSTDHCPLTTLSLVWGERVKAVESELAAIQAEIDERCFDLYGIGEEDRRAIAPTVRPEPVEGREASRASTGSARTEDEAVIQHTRQDGSISDSHSDEYIKNTDAEADDGDEVDETAAADAASLTAELVSWAFGASFGRFDVRLATGEREPPPPPEPFDPLPACSAGMLTGSDGLPCAAPPEGYPVAFPADGILVDDPGHPRDIETAISGQWSVASGQWSVASGQLPVNTDHCSLTTDHCSLTTDHCSLTTHLEEEVCEILGIKSLREYFRKPGLFFADHLKRYSKSRRKAPIYWPLSTASGSYTLWVYYHRLTDQTLFTCITDFVEPRIADTEKDLARLRAAMAETPSAKDRKAAEDLESQLHELKDFRDELLRVAQLPYKPDLNDGVMITAAPLAKLFLHKPWQKELLACWKKLEAGEYDWAHLALSIWPARVREKCKTDKSLAIAHNLESLYVAPPEAPKKKRRITEAQKHGDGNEQPGLGDMETPE